MSIRKNTENRLNLIRTCHTCGRTFSTTASSPWMRQITNVDGKKQKTCYFCSSACFKDSYKHVGFYDGKTEQRRAEREKNRDIKSKNKRYYYAHKDQERARARARYWVDPESARLSNLYNKRKSLLMKQESDEL